MTIKYIGPSFDTLKVKGGAVNNSSRMPGLSKAERGYAVGQLVSVSPREKCCVAVFYNDNTTQI